MSTVDSDQVPCTAPKGTGKVKCGKPSVALTDPPRCTLHIERDFAPNGGTARTTAPKTSSDLPASGGTS